MRIYLSHSSSLNYRRELYDPIKSSTLSKQHEFILPHAESGEPLSTKELISGCDLVVADISEKSTGSGIEIGWADVLNVPVVCIHKKGSAYSPAVEIVADSILSYEDSKSLIEVLGSAIDQYRI